MDSALLQPFDDDTPYNLAFEDQSQIKSPNTNDTCDSGLRDAAPNLTACLSCAEQNGLMFLMPFD